MGLSPRCAACERYGQVVRTELLARLQPFAVAGYRTVMFKRGSGRGKGTVSGCSLSGPPCCWLGAW